MFEWNGKRFSVFTSEEKSVLKLIKSMGYQLNWVTDAIPKLVTDYMDKLKSKTDKMGNHEGSWQGLNKPTLSDEGMRATVEKINDVDIPTINSSLAEKAKYLKLSKLGMSENSVENLNKILSNLTDNNIYFIVDGVYKLSTDSVKRLNYDFNLISYTNGEIILDGTDDTFFDTKANVSIKNVKFTNANTSTKVLFSTFQGNNSSLEKFNIENCEFNGTIRLGYLQYCAYIKEINILNNVIKNTKISFFQTSDFKICNVNINNNYVENWFYRCFSLTNFENIESITMENNHATNTDGWIFEEITEEGTYYVFGLLKAKNVYYRNNRVENMKARYNIALYDCYIYADKTISENNIFKNNICFDITAQNVFMKSKNEGSIKLFKNNTYIIEDEFLSKFNINRNVKIKMYDIWGGYLDEVHLLPVKFTFDGNIIITPTLKLEDGYRLHSEFIFKNNTIIADNIIDGLVNSKNNDCLISIYNNKITCKIASNFALVKGTSGIKYNNVVIENNVIKGIKYLVESASSKIVIIKNNFIECSTSESNVNYLTTYLNADSLICSNNIVNGAIDRNINNNLNSSYVIEDNTGIISGSNLYIHTLLNKTISIEVNDMNTISKFNVSVGNSSVTFTDTNNQSRTFSMLTSEGNGVSVKNLGDGTSSVTFNNNTSTSRINLKTNITKNINVKISVS